MYFRYVDCNVKISYGINVIDKNYVISEKP